MSHGASEKQRRDRINAMIDELRVLVPSSAAVAAARGLAREPGGGEGGQQDAMSDGRRSKFVVLRDTIDMLKLFEETVMEQEAELRKLRQLAGLPEERSGLASFIGGVAGVRGMPYANNGGLEVEPAAATATTAAVTPGSMTAPGLAAPNLTGQEAPPSVHAAFNTGHQVYDQNAAAAAAAAVAAAAAAATADEDMGDGGGGAAPAPAPLGGLGASTIHIAVDMGEQNCFIKVQAPDRRGLLQDILKSLQLLPMDVRRAAVTTDTDQMGVVRVTDIFELDIRDGPRISSDEVKRRLQRSLYEAYMAYENPDTYNKKRKGEEGSATLSGNTNSGHSGDFESDSPGN